MRVEIIGEDLPGRENFQPGVPVLKNPRLDWPSRQHDVCKQYTEDDCSGTYFVIFS